MEIEVQKGKERLYNLSHPLFPKQLLLDFSYLIALAQNLGIFPSVIFFVSKAFLCEWKKRKALHHW